MTPDDFASRFPRLYHLTRPEVRPLIDRHGLLSTAQLCEIFEVPEAQCVAILAQRRPKSVTLTHPVHGRAVIHDNAPLSEKALRKCLDDDLTPAEWLRMLNARVFFFTAHKKAETLASGPAHRGQSRDLLIIDSLSFLRAHIDRVTISPINTGSTIHRPTRRGHATFARLKDLEYDAWRRLRGLTSLDRPNELSVIGGVPDIADHLIEVVRLD